MKKRRRTRSDGGGSHVDLADGVSVGPFAFQHGPYTVEGGLERQQAFLDGVRRTRGWKHIVGLALVVLLLGGLVVTVLLSLRSLLH
jgi:hypothetical protein